MNRRAQNTLEYVVVIGVVIAALLMMGRYFTRSFVGKWRQAGDTFGKGETYKPK